MLVQLTVYCLSDERGQVDVSSADLKQGNTCSQELSECLIANVGQIHSARVCCYPLNTLCVSILSTLKCH